MKTVRSLECYIVLEQHQPFAIVHRRTDAGFLREAYEGVESNIDLPLLGCSLSLRDIYEGIEFTPTCVQEPDPEYEIDLLKRAEYSTNNTFNGISHSGWVQLITTSS